jgi:N-acetylglucosamine-6-sulfatase
MELRHTRRLGWGCLVFVALCLLLAFAPSAEAKPNLLLIVTDDQRYDSLAVMPSTRANFDIDFKTAIVTTPLCCPSRASILTGEYAHNHGVKTNLDAPIFTARAADSLGPWLQQQGYFTGLVGRYLNKYTFTDPLPAGFDEARYMVWDEDRNRLGNFHTIFTLREFWKDANGDSHDEVVAYPNDANPAPYSTRVFGALGAGFIRRAHDPAINPEGKPWALVVWPTAPHAPLIVEPRYSDALVPPWTRAPSFLEEDLRDKPREVRELATSHGRSYFVSRRDKTLRMLMSVDDMVERIWDTIDDYGERPNTAGIYSSDNGFFFGEHRLTSKLLGYEESTRVPFRMAVPGIGPVQIGRSTVANIDIAPTLMALAGAPALESFDGQSLLPLLSGECLCGRRVLIENWFSREYQAVRAPRWKYIRWSSGAEELYALARDPYELENVARQPAQAAILAALRAELDSLLLE